MSKLAWKDFSDAILRGGAQAALDYGVAAGTKQGDTAPEQTAPSGTVKDRDTATAGAKASANPLELFDGRTVLIAIGGGIVVIAVMVLAFKSLGKK